MNKYFHLVSTTLPQGNTEAELCDNECIFKKKKCCKKYKKGKRCGSCPKE